MEDIDSTESQNKRKFSISFSYSKDENCELAQLCERYGSDKGEITPVGHPYPWPSHSYTDFYRRLWGHCRTNVKKVFECGIGTNNPSLPSSMGVGGKPGASLRVWRDYFPNALIYGADIDKEIIFLEERIKTYFLDQLNPTSILKFWREVGENNFDFMIDDGLHEFEAGASLFVNSIDKLSKTGVYVIEDVNQNDLRKYKNFFKAQRFVVDFVSLHRPGLTLGDNNLVVIRK